VYGCERPLAFGTLGCNLTSILNITGSGFIAPAVLEIAYNVNCTLATAAVRSSTSIITPLCPYYYPMQQDTMWDIRLWTGNTPSAPLTAALTFADTAPIVTSITSATCDVPPNNGCNNLQPNTFTVTGSNFLPSPLPRVNAYFWLGASTYLPCTTRVETLQRGRFECTIPSFTWVGQPPPATVKFSGFAAVVDANWLGEEYFSNVLPAVISFNQPRANRSSSSSSSSTGGGRGQSSTVPINQPPTITRISGCEDSFNNTRNCPYPWPSTLTITLYGSRFQAYISSIRIWIGGQPCTDFHYYRGPPRLLCQWNVSAVNYAVTGTTPLQLAFNSSAGFWINVSSAVNVNEAAVHTRPVISSISGCQPAGLVSTANCDRTNTLTLYGESFARYLPPTLNVWNHIVRCGYSDVSGLGIECPLREVWSEFADVPRHPNFVAVSLQLGDRSLERYSDGVSYVSFAVDVPVPPIVSSTGGGGVTGDAGGSDADELVGMKLALLSMMIISLIVLVVALAVWVTGWWLAHRRSYVSQHGQAAVDARQVLLQ